VLTGSFTEQDDQPHVRSRHQMLDAGVVLRPPFDGVTGTCAPHADKVMELVAPSLRDHGAAVVLLEEPFTDGAFADFGTRLGTAAPETDPAVRPFVTNGVILNLISKHGRTSDVTLQPFAENSLSLHSEGSGRPATEQPRHIVLMCCHPGADPTSSQTVLVNMAEVAARLSTQDLDVLARTRYAHLPSGETILRGDPDRPMFSFRDFLGDRLDWVDDGDDVDDPAAVNDAVEHLLTAMYTAPANGVHWRRGLLVVIDNTRHFHGRTAGLSVPERPRHLKRLRIR
jgi:alpha-ketoglutarate-dependent taurine dioxygenase